MFLVEKEVQLGHGPSIFRVPIVNKKLSSVYPNNALVKKLERKKKKKVCIIIRERYECDACMHLF